MQFDHYGWDPKKRLANLKKHYLDFRDAPKIFEGPLLIDLDQRHDYGEERFTAIGYIENRVVLLVFSEPSQATCRCISLRKATKGEQEAFRKVLSNRLETS